MYNHLTYMQAVAASLLAAPDYFPAFGVEDLEMFHSKLSSVKGKVLIAIDAMEEDHTVNGADAMNAASLYSFIIAGPTNSSKPDSIFTMRDQCKAIAKQVIAKLQLDLSIDIPNGFKVNGAGPIGDNFYGVFVSFSVIDPEAYTLDSLMWKE